MMQPYTESSRVVINGPYATLAFDKNGVLYIAHTASDPKFANPHPPSTIPRHVILARSTDGGRTIQTAMVYKGPEEAAETAGDLPVTGQNGRAMVALDPRNSSRVYVAWARSGSGTKEKAKSLIAASATTEAMSHTSAATRSSTGSQPLGTSRMSEGRCHRRLATWRASSEVERPDRPSKGWPTTTVTSAESSG